MAPRSTSKSGLFLLEMVLVILFFAFTSAICVQLFAQAHLISGHSTALNQAMLRAQSAAELFRGSGDRELLARELEGRWEENTLTCPLDAHWAATSAGEAAYTLTLRLDTQPPQLEWAQIQVVDCRRQQELFALHTTRATGSSPAGTEEGVQP